MKNSKFKTMKAKMAHQKKMTKLNTKRKVKLAKIDSINKMSKTKILAGEAGKTARNIAANLTASKGVERVTAAEQQRMATQAAESNKSAIDLYNQMIAGLGNEGQTGKTQNDSTTTVGGSGSKLGG